jgi:hypothetical protein
MKYSFHFSIVLVAQISIDAFKFMMSVVITKTDFNQVAVNVTFGKNEVGWASMYNQNILLIP